MCRVTISADLAVPAPASTVVRYEPRGAARQLFACRSKAVVIVGPAGTGKSLAGLWRLHSACLARPGLRCLIVRKTAVTLGSTTLATFDEEVLGAETAQAWWYGGSQRQAAGYRYPNGSKINVGGLDNPLKIMSSSYDLILVDEATEISEDDYEKLRTRLRHFVLAWQQIILACNPAHPTHWIKQFTDAGLIPVLVSRHTDNPAYYSRGGVLTAQGQAYVVDTLGALTGVRRLRLLLGQWAAAEGIIYEEWDDSLHLVDPFPVPAAWTRRWSVDFGFTNPSTIGCWAEDPDGRQYLYREIYRTGQLVEDLAGQILDTCTIPTKDYEHPAGQPRHAHHGRTWVQPRPRSVICDHDAEDRATLERHLGLGTIAAFKSVKPGIEAVKVRLHKAGDGKPRLFVMRDALVQPDPARVAAKRPISLASEIGGYIWAPGADGKPAKEEPHKYDDHAVDAMRYLVADVDLAPRPRVRFF